METHAMSHSTSTPAATLLGHGSREQGLLRASLKLDAAATGAVGAASLVGGPFVADLLALPGTLLVSVGGFLVAYAALVWLAGASRTWLRRGAQAAIAVNLAWVALSVVALAAGWLTPAPLGTALVLLQAGAVTLFALLQIVALARSRAA